jgi:hypothetical protein
MPLPALRHGSTPPFAAAWTAAQPPPECIGDITVYSTTVGEREEEGKTTILSR